MGSDLAALLDMDIVKIGLWWHIQEVFAMVRWGNDGWSLEGESVNGHTGKYGPMAKDG